MEGYAGGGTVLRKEFEMSSNMAKLFSVKKFPYFDAKK